MPQRLESKTQVADTAAREAMQPGNETLLNAIYENPADDGARRVYADWLIEQGDPRGELIMLQVARASNVLPSAAERREVELLWKHGRDWLGPFTKAIERYRFDRGFLAEAELTAVTKKMVGDPSWSTVERMTFKDVDSVTVAELLSHDSMRALQEARGVGGQAFRALCEAGMGTRLRRLEVVGVDLLPMETVRGFPGLKNLERLTFLAEP